MLHCVNSYSTALHCTALHCTALAALTASADGYTYKAMYGFISVSKSPDFKKGRPILIDFDFLIDLSILEQGYVLFSSFNVFLIGGELNLSYPKTYFGNLRYNQR